MAVEINKQGNPEKPHFLIVDGDHQSVVSVSRMLEAFGSRVDAANCGSAALNCLSESLYDVVITDLGLQGSNGIEFACQVKDTFPQIRTIIMTGHNCTETECHIKRTNADGCITKPVDMNNLKSVLNDIFQF